jgi:hypothetical protein
LGVEVATAMLHFHDLAWLAESELCELSQVQTLARGSHVLFAEGIALRQLLESSAKTVLDRLPRGDRRLDRIRFTLEGVLEGRSIAALAREQGRTREYWSRSVWREAAALVARELVQQERSRVSA